MIQRTFTKGKLLQWVVTVLCSLTTLSSVAHADRIVVENGIDLGNAHYQQRLVYTIPATETCTAIAHFLTTDYGGAILHGIESNPIALSPNQTYTTSITLNGTNSPKELDAIVEFSSETSVHFNDSNSSHVVTKDMTLDEIIKKASGGLIDFPFTLIDIVAKFLKVSQVGLVSDSANSVFYLLRDPESKEAEQAFLIAVLTFDPICTPGSETVMRDGGSVLPINGTAFLPAYFSAASNPSDGPRAAVVFQNDSSLARISRLELQAVFLDVYSSQPMIHGNGAWYVTLYQGDSPSELRNNLNSRQPIGSVSLAASDYNENGQLGSYTLTSVTLDLDFPIPSQSYVALEISQRVIVSGNATSIPYLIGASQQHSDDFFCTGSTPCTSVYQVSNELMHNIFAKVVGDHTPPQPQSASGGSGRILEPTGISTHSSASLGSKAPIQWNSSGVSVSHEEDPIIPDSERR